MNFWCKFRHHRSIRRHASVWFRFSVLWRCWLGSRKGIWRVKNWVVGCWHSYLSEARCRHAWLLPLPLTVSCFTKIQIGFTFLVPAYPGSPRQRAVKRVCVCVCACVRACVRACVCACVCVLGFKILYFVKGFYVADSKLEIHLQHQLHIPW